MTTALLIGVVVGVVVVVVVARLLVGWASE